MPVPDNPLIDLSALQKPLDQFRTKSKRPDIHPREILLIGAVALHLIFLPWALGAVRLWAQYISFGLAVLGFLIALIPRDYTEEQTGQSAFRLYTWTKLVRFPVFWLGLALLALVTLQGLNPAYRFTDTPDKTGWFMNPIAHLTWLPSGVEVPFERGGGPWRSLMVYASVWLLVCTAWIGFTRRRTLQIVFVIIAANGFALAGLGLAQRFLPSDKIFWSVASPGVFFSSFTYKNFAGGYLNLALAVAGGLAAWFYYRGLRRMEKSNPAGLFVFFATLIGISILISFARGATMMMLAFLAGAISVFLYQQFFSKDAVRRPVIIVVLVLVFGFFLKTGLDAINSGEAWSRLSIGLEGRDGSIRSRAIATEAATDMLKQTWKLGAGAGSFRYLFPQYQQHYPEIFTEGGARLFWNHAHNDLIEFPLELGVPGMVLLLAIAAYWFVRLVRARFWLNPLTLCVVFGLLLTLVNCRWEFLLQCPAILLTWCLLWALVVRWTELEEANPRI